MSMTMKTREEWLNAAAKAMKPWLLAHPAGPLPFEDTSACRLDQGTTLLARSLGTVLPQIYQSSTGP